jgi:hypothetical protein
VAPQAPALNLPVRPTPTTQAPRFPFEAVFGTRMVDATRLALEDRAPMLTSLGAAACNGLAQLSPRATRLHQFVDLFVAKDAWDRAPGKHLEVAAEVKRLLEYMLTGATDANAWFIAMGWLIQAPGELTRKLARAMIVRWRTGDATLGNQAMLVLLQDLSKHLQPRVVDMLSNGPPNAFAIADIRTLHGLVWVPVPLPGNVAIPKPAFADLFWKAVKAVASDDALDQAVVGAAPLTNTVNLVYRMRALNATWAECCQLLFLLPNIVVAPNRLTRIREYIRDSGAALGAGWNWQNVLKVLANFIQSGRVGYVPADDVAIEGPAEHSRDVALAGGDVLRLILTQRRAVYFAEAHTYACGDISEPALARAPAITFWGPATDQAVVTQRARAVIDSVAAYNLAVSDWGNRNAWPYMQGTIGGDEVGIQLRGYTALGAGRRQYNAYLTHFAPGAPGAVPLAVLRAARRLLQ